MLGKPSPCTRLQAHYYLLSMNYKQLIVNELHKAVRKNFPRRNTVVKGINDLFQADIVEMCLHSKVNSAFKYILTLINCFSKMAYAYPLKSKSGKETAEGMKEMLKQNKLKFRHLQTDQGKEYYNSYFSDLMKKHGINHYSTYSDKKAAIIERFNRTLKSAMYKQFSLRGSYKWIDILSNLVAEYNNRVHRTIKMRPRDVNKSNEAQVLKNIKRSTKVKLEPGRSSKLQEGDKVRVSKYKGVFTKGYLPNWSNEVFEVYRVQPTTPQTYLLKDGSGEIIKGGFYEYELLKTKSRDVYLVEKILKRSGNKCLVRWLGFDKSHDSWVSKDDIL